MKVESKQTYDDDSPQNPKIPEDYYETELVEIIDYPRDGRDAPGFILKFKVLDEDVELENDFDRSLNDGNIVVPFFAPAKLSYSEDAESSRLTDNLMKLGIHDAVLEELGVREEVMEKDMRVIPDDDEDIESLKSTLNGFLKGKTVKVDISYGQKGEESQVNKFSSFVDDEDVIFGDDEE